MSSVRVPWGAWYGSGTKDLSFPEGWDVVAARPNGRSDAGSDDIENAFLNPVGSKRLGDLARGKRSAAIAIDDLTRPTDGRQMLPYVLRELSEGGIPEKDISIFLALGSHRALTRQDIEKKIGSEILQRYRVRNHSPFYNVIDLGVTEKGTPIHVNRDFAAAELKIAVGFIMPHKAAGWGGGAKIIMPGLCGIETLTGVHGGEMRLMSKSVPAGGRKRMREEIEEIAERIGLNFIVNVIGNEWGRALTVVTGAPRPAHARGVELAAHAYQTDVEGEYDIGVFNAFPDDTEFRQAGKALNYLSVHIQKAPIRVGGDLVIATAASEGHGVHHLMGHGTPLQAKAKGHRRLMNVIEGKWRLQMYSPQLSAVDADEYPDHVKLYSDWDKLIRSLNEGTDKRRRALVFPCGPLQIPPIPKD